MIHEIINSVTISSDRTAAVWENKNRKIRKNTIKQWNYINYYSRKISIIDADLIL